MATWPDAAVGGTPAVRQAAVCLAGRVVAARGDAGGRIHAAGREALLRYVLRPPLAEQGLERGRGRLVRILLKRAYPDGTVAVELDPLSLLCRLATCVPPPRFHTVNYSGVLAPASALRPRITPKPKPAPAPEPEAADRTEPPERSAGYRPWAELLKRTFEIDVLQCMRCNGRMKLVALLTEPRSIARYLEKLGEATEPPSRTPSRGPPHWISTVLRQRATTS